VKTVSALESNKAETKTMLPVTEAFITGRKRASRCFFCAPSCPEVERQLGS
jgi:hypothetical protein